MAGETLLTPSTVLDCLLSTPIPERDVLIARQVYQNLPDKVCVWTGKSLHGERFDIDHAIPYSLWHNNDTWNLLPSSPGANNAKRDSLPSRRLLHKRRDCVIHYWEQMRDACEVRFLFEASRLAGPLPPANANWQNLLFSAFTEAIELTASTHRHPRWEG